MGDDILKELTAELSTERRAAELREASLHDIRVLITSLRNHGYVAEVAKGASAYQLSIGIDLGRPEPEAIESDIPLHIDVVAPSPEPLQTPCAAPEPVEVAPVPVVAPPADPLPPRSNSALTQEQADIALDMTLKGEGPTAIAARLGVDKKTIANWKFRNKHRLVAVPNLPDEAPHTHTVPDDAPYNIRVIHAHLNAVGYADGWSAERDLALVSRLVRGAKVTAAAHDLGLDKDAVIARWRQINTEPGNLRHQSDLIAVLKHRAGV